MHQKRLQHGDDGVARRGMNLTIDSPSPPMMPMIIFCFWPARWNVPAQESAQDPCMVWEVEGLAPPQEMRRRPTVGLSGVEVSRLSGRRGTTRNGRIGDSRTQGPTCEAHTYILLYCAYTQQFYRLSRQGIQPFNISHPFDCCLRESMSWPPRQARAEHASHIGSVKGTHWHIPRNKQQGMSICVCGLGRCDHRCVHIAGSCTFTLRILRQPPRMWLVRASTSVNA